MQFSHTCPKNYSRTFQWRTEAECQAMGVILRAPVQGTEISPLVHAPVGISEDDLEVFLRTNHMDITKFGVDGVKTLKEFSEELVKGEAQLIRKPDGNLIRLVDVVILKCVRKSKDVVVAVSELTCTGSDVLERLPAVKRRADENPFWAAKRVLSNVLKISEDLVEMDQNNVVLVEEEAMSKAYAGLPTIYRRLVISATVKED